jgi:hypothetical protein
LQESTEVADATPASTIEQSDAHAASPVGQVPATHCCAAPGAPLTPSQAHCQQ